MRKCLLVVMMLLFAGVGVQGQNADGGKYKLAVYVAGKVNGSAIDAETEMSTEMTAMDMLVNSGKFEMINRSSAFKEQVKREIKEQQGGDVRDEDIALIGRDFGAQKICVVLILANTNSKELKVNARIVDVETKQAVGSGLSKNYTYNGSAQSRDNAVEDAVNKLLGNSSSAGGNGGSTPPNAAPTGTDLTFTVGNVSFKMVFVKGGTFQMGSYSGENNEKPVHNVTVSDFYMGEFEVTQALWQEVMGTSIYQQGNKANTDRSLYGVGDGYPMYYVSHSEAEEFCGRLNQRLRGQLPAGYSFALPTEAEWEYAARGGSKTHAYTYSGSNYLSDVGWYWANSNSTTHAVGTKRPNELGLYDMSGNVWEWCADWYGESYYSSSPSQDPRGPSSGLLRVLRGGSWFTGESYCRVAYRAYIDPGDRRKGHGFRLSLVRR